MNPIEKLILALIAVACLASCATTEIATLRADGKAIVAVAKKSALQALTDSITRALTDSFK